MDETAAASSPARPGCGSTAAAARSSGGGPTRRSTTTAWPPTSRATASSTAPPPASSTSGRSRPRRGRPPRRSRCRRGKDGRTGVTTRSGPGRLAGRARPRRPGVHGLARGRPAAAAVRPAGDAPRTRACSARQGLIPAETAERICAALAARRDRAGRHRRGRPLGHRAAAGRARPVGARRPQPQRPGADRDAAVGEGRLRPAGRGRARARRSRCSTWPSATATRSCPATPTASAPSRCGSGQHLAAHVWALQPRPRRLGQVRASADVCPLGAGALAGSSLPLDPASVAAGARLRRGVRELDGRGLRPRLLRRARVRLRALLRAPVAAGRGARAVDVGRVRLRRARRLGRHRLVDDAAEEEPRRGRAGAGQGRHRGRAAGRAAGDAEGAAAGLQPRPAGGQAGLLRPGRRPAGGARRRCACASRASRSTPTRMAAAAGDGTTVATDVAERLVQRGHALPRGPRTRWPAASRRASGSTRRPPAEAAAARQPLEALHEQLARARSAVSRWLTGGRACAGIVVVKVGSSTLVDDAGRPRLPVFERVAGECAELVAAGTPVVVVSSGAVALGHRRARQDHPPAGDGRPAGRLGARPDAAAAALGAGVRRRSTPHRPGAPDRGRHPPPQLVRERPPRAAAADVVGRRAGRERERLDRDRRDHLRRQRCAGRARRGDAAGEAAGAPDRHRRRLRSRSRRGRTRA